MLYWLTHPVAIAAIISFFVGSFGFVVGRLVIFPLVHYARLKRRIGKTLVMAISEDGPRDSLSRMIREHASALNTCARNMLPNWYLMALNNRGEWPDEAVKHLMALANIHNRDHARRRVERIRHVLNLT